MMRLLILVPFALSACTSDGDKRGDAGDAGVVAQAEEPKDAGAPDAGALVNDAGSGAIPVVADLVDSGTMHDVVVASDGGKKVPPVIDGGLGKDAGKDGINVTVWNRILAKAHARDLSPVDVQDMVEKATGQKVEKVRKTAGTFWLIQFAPVTPVRKKEDQQKLIDVLKATKAFATVEGDQVMTLK